MAKAIGAKIVDAPEEATHLITIDGTLKRTPKLMVAINCGVKYIVGLSW